MRPRAVAPPLGDMAVGTMLINNRSFVQASGPPVSLTLNKAPAKDALMSLARLGGYGFVYVGDSNSSVGAEGDSSEYPVTMAFRDERYDRALNSVLTSSLAIGPTFCRVSDLPSWQCRTSPMHQLALV